MKKVIKKRNRNLHLLELSWWVLLFSLVLVILLTFIPTILQDIKYNLTSTRKELFENPVDNDQLDTNAKDTKSVSLIPPNYDFSIVIPKIDVSAPVFSNTDPFNEKEFRKVLKEGVAHAKGTAMPGEAGNSFIFAHSTNIFENVNKYNAIFYLIGKLENNDKIYVFYKNQRFTYVVYDKKVVSSDSLQYLQPLIKDGRTLTLSTCYPPGTTWKRLIVLAIIKE